MQLRGHMRVCTCSDVSLHIELMYNKAELQKVRPSLAVSRIVYSNIHVEARLEDARSKVLRNVGIQRRYR